MAAGARLVKEKEEKKEMAARSHEAELRRLREAKGIAGPKALAPDSLGKLLGMLNPENLELWLAEANAYLAAGQDLSRMPAEAQKAVEIKAANRVSAARVGLTAWALDLVKRIIHELNGVIGDPKALPPSLRDAEHGLVAFRAVISANDASMDLESDSGVERGPTMGGPAPDHSGP
jgi:hypothetical protein